jgi:hypothetical protein
LERIKLLAVIDSDETRGNFPNYSQQPTKTIEVLHEQKDRIDNLVSFLAQIQLNMESCLPKATTESNAAKYRQMADTVQKCVKVACDAKAVVDDGCQLMLRAGQYSYEALVAIQAHKILMISAKKSAEIIDIVDQQPKVNVIGCFDFANAMEILIKRCEILASAPAGLVHPLQQLEANHRTREIEFCNGFGGVCESLIEELLLGTQRLCKVSMQWKADVEDIIDDDNKSLLSKQNLYFNDLFKGANLDGVGAKLQEACMLVCSFADAADIQKQSSALVHNMALRLLACVRPMLASLVVVMQKILHSYIAFHAGVSKFLYVVLSICTDIMEKGFCAPVEDTDDVEGEGLDDNIAGTGMAEGEGKKDVSDEIEDEEQLIGLQGEKEEENQNEEDRGEGKEMENDFEGEMVDQKRDGSDSDSSAEEDQEDDLDREMDEGEQEQVDEKMWGDVDDMDEKDDAKDEQVDSTQQADDKTGGLQGQDDAKDKENKPEDTKEEQVQMPDDEPDDAADPEDPANEEKEQNFVDDAKPKDMELPDDMGIGDDEGEGGDSEQEQEDDQESPIDDTADAPESKPENTASPDDQPPDAEAEADADKDGTEIENTDELPEDNEGDEDDDGSAADGGDQQNGNDTDNDDDGDGDDSNEPMQVECGDREDEEDVEPPQEPDVDEADADVQADVRDTPTPSNTDDMDVETEDQQDTSAPDKPKPQDVSQKNDHTVMDHSKSSSNDASVVDQVQQDAGGGEEPTGENEEDDASAAQAAASGGQFSDSTVSKDLSNKDDKDSDTSQQMEKAQANPLENMVNAMQEWSERLNMVDTDSKDAESRPEEEPSDDTSQAADSYRFQDDESKKDDGTTMAPMESENNQEQMQPQEAKDSQDSQDKSEGVDDIKTIDPGTVYDEEDDIKLAPPDAKSQELTHNAAKILAAGGEEGEAGSDEDEGKPEQDEGVELRWDEVPPQTPHTHP